MNKSIALFDFDGTITTRDTMFDFLRFAFGKKKLTQGLIASAPFLLLFKLGLTSRQKAKEEFLHYFFKGLPYSELQERCARYANEIDKILNPAAIKKLSWHHEQGHEIIIISASVEDWVAPWARRNGIDRVIATRLNVIDGMIAEKFKTGNCHGPEKAARLLKEIPSIGEHILYAYGDSDGDREMLAMAQHKFYRRF